MLLLLRLLLQLLQFSVHMLGCLLDPEMKCLHTLTHTHTHKHTCTHLSKHLHACTHTHSATDPPAHTHINQTEQQHKLQMDMSVNQSHLLPSESTNFQDSLDCERMVRSKVVSPDETTQFSISGGQTRLVFHLKFNSHCRCCNKAKPKTTSRYAGELCMCCRCRS